MRMLLCVLYDYVSKALVMKVYCVPGGGEARTEGHMGTDASLIYL